jgi:hypothetical protein
MPYVVLINRVRRLPVHSVALADGSLVVSEGILVLCFNVCFFQVERSHAQRERFGEMYTV